MKKLVMLCLGLIPIVAQATLGESANSVNSDNKALASSVSLIVDKSINTTKSDGQNQVTYNISTIRTPEGITINEYVANGKVFAISWSGIRNPDLQQLMGQYFPQYKSAKRTQYGLSGAETSTGDLVVSTFGVIGDFHGLAYISSLVPDGLNPRDLSK